MLIYSASESTEVNEVIDSAVCMCVCVCVCVCARAYADTQGSA